MRSSYRILGGLLLVRSTDESLWRDETTINENPTTRTLPMMLTKLNDALFHFDKFKNGIFSLDFFLIRNWARHFSNKYGITYEATYLAIIWTFKYDEQLINSWGSTISRLIVEDDDFYKRFKLFELELVNLERFIEKCKSSQEKCCICKVKIPDIIFINCGHLVICHECKLKDQCPKCKVDSKTNQIFL